MINNIQHTIAILDINNQEKDDMLLKRQIRLMNGCAVKFRKLAFRYDHIAQSQMGVDNELLNIFECYKISALVCEHAARTFVGSKDLFFCIDPSLIPVLDEIRTEDKMEEDVEQSQLGRLMNLNKRFLKSIVKWEDSVEDDHSSRNDEMISMLEDILYKPLIIPRSFFHRQKKSPKKRIMNEVNTMNDNLIHIMQPGMDIIEYMDDSADLMQPYYE
ncbi:hypothetical protein BDB01DRAFT_557978 [Pilobolus umbonatus]|nr:hypothetical protein BDB01DRAFT_557978 [Pilobolus umbonatus]